MEFTELQNAWSQYDRHLIENTRINKEILKQMLQTKPQKRLSVMRIKAAFQLFLSIFGVVFIICIVPYRNEMIFYIAFGTLMLSNLISFYWIMKHYLLILQISFNDPVIEIQKRVCYLKKWKLNMTKWSYIAMPIAMICIFMAMNIPIFSKNMLVPLTLIVVVFIGSVIYNNHTVSDQFRKLNQELEEIGSLEKEQ